MRYIYLALATLCFHTSAEAQYISLTQVPDNSCPVVCPGSTIVLEVYEVQNLNNGDTLQALVSNASGSFGSGTTTLSCTVYSVNTGTSWTNGPYIYYTSAGTVTDLYFEITIPQNFPVGSNYSVEMKSSSGYLSNAFFRCTNNPSYITVTAAYATLAAMPANSVGNNQWIGSVYTWNTAIPQSTVLNTPVLINEVNFFDSTNYKGYFLLDSLSFYNNWQTSGGGTCPGTPGTLNNGTSIPCSEGFSTLYSIRLEREENFPSGMYQFAIDADDGIRLSIDGGNTWLLNAFYEEEYDTSYRSTAAKYPGGICLSGATHLVIEYFQRYVQSIIYFKDSLISSNSATINNPGNQTGCAGSNVSFNLSSNSNSLTYQWYYNTNTGSGFVPVPNSAPFFGVDSSILTITNLPLSYNGYLFECEITGVCSGITTTSVDTLFIGGSSPSYTNPGNQTGCPGGNVAFNLNNSSNSLTFQWYYSTNGGSSFSAVPNSAPFSGVNSSALSVTGLILSYNNYLFECQISGGCTGVVTTAVDTLFVGGNGAAATLNADKNPICANDSAHICVVETGTSYRWNTGATTQCIYAHQAGDYYATVTYSTGCAGISNHYPLSVYPVPSVSITVAGDTLTSYDAVTYQWLINNQIIPGATNPVYIVPQPGAYSVEITDSNGCMETSSQVNIGAVNAGINEIGDNADFNIYPNPVTDNSAIVVITAPAFEGKQLRLFDTEGCLVGNWIVNNSKTELPLATLARGVYFLKFKNAVRKIIKE